MVILLCPEVARLRGWSLLVPTVIPAGASHHSPSAAHTCPSTLFSVRIDNLVPPAWAPRMSSTLFHSSEFSGVVVPMPTLPLEVTRILSDPLVLMARG